ncbi:LRR receptor-like serine threonine-protein kinase [Seminavis robusta]|uniref:LRR receptor-like serine threonine-protein kinase n=1 Tax=Seminavis robusta TaxID=568900 RepID=A0A9N8EWK7_9STRA|nr:LRR receptor-like serine threonine-protein kinase [Seminavis robusta]|eukprot:Sro2146_g316430.1 LRR receptor-like serine threonine-protein kinase (933) ;mRNA; f:8297-11095
MNAEASDPDDKQTEERAETPDSSAVEQDTGTGPGQQISDTNSTTNATDRAIRPSTDSVTHASVPSNNRDGPIVMAPGPDDHIKEDIARQRLQFEQTQAANVLSSTQVEERAETLDEPEVQQDTGTNHGQQISDTNATANVTDHTIMHSTDGVANTSVPTDPSSNNDDPMAMYEHIKEDIAQQRLKFQENQSANILSFLPDDHIKSEITQARRKFEEQQANGQQPATFGAGIATPSAPTAQPGAFAVEGGRTGITEEANQDEPPEQNQDIPWDITGAVNIQEAHVAAVAQQPLALGQNSLPPPPELARQGPRSRAQMPPGAYSEGDGRESAGGGTISIGSTTTFQENNSTGGANNNGGNNTLDNSAPLLEATLVGSRSFQVDEERDLPQAEILEPKSMVGHWMESTSTQGKLICILIVAIALGLAITGLVCGTSNVCGGGGGEMSNENDEMSTLAPTFSWVSDFPDFTLEALQDPVSSQAQAYDWMVDGYGEERLSEMPDWRRAQIFAIGCFYYAFDGSTRPGLLRDNAFFNTSLRECGDWNGTHTKFGCTEEGRLQHFKITVSPVDIVGVIPPEVVLLDQLDELAITKVKLIGNLTSIVPTQLELLPSIRILDLSENQVTGTIPEYMSDMKQLEVIDFYKNAIGGTVPWQLMYDMPNLINLHLGTNVLGGTIPKPPPAFATPSLARVAQGDNMTNSSLESSIDDDVNSYVPLESLELHLNTFSGTLPTELSYLQNLQNFLLSTNQITGPIPTELFLLTKLERLRLHTNPMTGSLSAEIGLLSKLTYLSVANLELTGSIPSEVAMASNLRFLSFGGNQNMQGTIPSELGLLTKLTLLTVGGGMTGSIPDSICQLTLPREDGGGKTKPLSLTIACDTMDECPTDCVCECGAEEVKTIWYSGGSSGGSGGGTQTNSNGGSSTGNSNGGGSGGSRG